MPNAKGSRRPDQEPLWAEEDRIDRTLMAAIRDGQAHAYGTLLGRYWRTLVEYAFSLIDDVDVAEDVVQETFVRVWETRERWQPTGSVRSFLYVVARNLALQERERRAVRTGWARSQRDVERLSPSPADTFDAEELSRLLVRALGALPGRRREVFILARFHGMTYRQIAQIMAISPQTVANQMSAALAELRRALGASLRS